MHSKIVEVAKLLTSPHNYMTPSVMLITITPCQVSLMKDLEKENTRTGASTLADNGFRHRRGSADNSVMDKSLLDGFVVVEHHMIPRELTIKHLLFNYH